VIPGLGVTPGSLTSRIPPSVRARIVTPGLRGRPTTATPLLDGPLQRRVGRRISMDCPRFGFGHELPINAEPQRSPMQRLAIRGCSATPEYAHSFPYAWASTFHSSTSVLRDTSVKRSAVLASPSFVAVSMAARAVRPNAASAMESAVTCAWDEAASSGYSASRDRLEATRTVPKAVPPSATARPARSSADPPTALCPVSNS